MKRIISITKDEDGWLPFVLEQEKRGLRSRIYPSGLTGSKTREAAVAKADKLAEDYRSIGIEVERSSI
jgi:hypothetical protein